MSIVREQSPEFDFSVPVAVIGAGACGLTAALATRDAGVEFLVIERDKRRWGSTSMSLGAVCGVNSAQQAAHGVSDSVELFVADVMAKTEGRADPGLARLIGEQSGATLDWLSEHHQVPLLLDFKWTGLGHSRPRLHIPPGRSGEELLALLANACGRARAQIVTEARVTGLYADADDRVLGLQLQRPDGSIERLGCEALVLATCGFGGNPAMVAKYIPQMATARYFGHEGNQGDGIRWGLELGAAVADMTAYQGLGTLADPQQIIVPHPLMIEGGFLVNARGERFTHELADISGMCVPVLGQPGGLAWVVFDERRNQDCLAHSLEQRQLSEVGAIRSAASWVELERLCQLPEGSLAKENAAVDAARPSGANDRFGRSFAGLKPLQPPLLCHPRHRRFVPHPGRAADRLRHAGAAPRWPTPAQSLRRGRRGPQHFRARRHGLLAGRRFGDGDHTGAHRGASGCAADSARARVKSALSLPGRPEIRRQIAYAAKCFGFAALCLATLTGALEAAEIHDIAYSPPGESRLIPLRVSAPATGRRLPVVVFSHGAYASKDDYSAILDYWADAGYAVFAVTHRDSTKLGVTRGSNNPSFFEWRLDDLQAVLRNLDAIVAQVPDLRRRVDLTRIAATGHSFGGLVAQTLGGATYQDAARGGITASRLDPRVRAVIIFSGAGTFAPLLAPENFASLRLPTLVTVGTNDLQQAPTISGYEWRRQPYDLIAPGRKYLLSLAGSDHYLGGIVGRNDLPRSDNAAQYLADFNRWSTCFLDAYLGDRRTARRELESLPRSPAKRSVSNVSTLEQR